MRPQPPSSPDLGREDVDGRRLRSSRLPASPASARLAREMVRQVTDQPENARIALIVTELVTNAVHHARSAPFFTVVADDRRIRIEVEDDDPTHPIVRPFDAEATSGRGMALVEAVADRWGVLETRRGKTVWAEIDGAGLDIDLGE